MRSFYLFFLLPVVICSSCGTGKKLETANQQITVLNRRIDSLNKINQDCQSSVTQLKAENIQYGKEAEDCRKAKEVNAARLARYEQSLEQNGKSMEKIRDKIAKALEQFKDAGLTIKYKNGLVYVTMQDKLMFPSGSTKIKDQGRQALSVIADAMNEFSHLTVYVVGNTDTVPVIKGFKDNWSLSTKEQMLLSGFSGTTMGQIHSALLQPAGVNMIPLLTTQRRKAAHKTGESISS